ncbi:retrovirus-related pol polyprotein from transposon TNT 1-94 [Tanacetum coccineum]
MSTSKTYQQSLVDAGSKTRPPMLERGSYIPWASRKSNEILNPKRENQKWLLKALEDGPYVFRNITPTGSALPRLQDVEDLQGDDLLYYDAEMKLTNMILLSFPNEFTNLEKKLENSHDPCASRHTLGFTSRNTSSYYVTHPPSIVDYDEEFEQDDVHNHSEDPLAFAMLLLAKVITQNFSNPTNNRLRASSNTRNQAVVQGDRVNIQSRNSGNVGRNNRRAYVQGEVIEGMNATNETANVQRIVRTPTSGNTSTGQCYNCGGKGHYARNCPKPKVRDSKYFMSKMLLQNRDEAGGIGSVEKDTYVYDQCALETLARNAYAEAAKQQRFAQKVQQQNMTLTSQIEMYKERNRVLENITKDNNYLKEFLEADERAKRVQKQADSQLYRDRDIIRDLEKQRDELSQEVKHFKQKNEELQQSHLILKRKMSENEDKYHDTILDLEEKLKKNVDMFLKIGNSLQAMFMLGPKPLSVYDQQLKHGLGYPNPYTLRQAISECPKLYVASRTGNIEIPLNVRDSEETLEDNIYFRIHFGRN